MISAYIDLRTKQPRQGCFILFFLKSQSFVNESIKRQGKILNELNQDKVLRIY